MPVGPPGWIHRMHQEHGCKFVSMAQVLASAEAGFVAWIGPKLLRCIEGFASFHPHLSLLLLGGGIWGVGGWEVEGWGGACPWVGVGQGMIEGQVLRRGRCLKISGDGSVLSGVPRHPSVS